MRRLLAVIISLSIVSPSFAAMKRLRYPSLQKPLVGTPLNSSHPLSKGLVGIWAMNESGGATLYNPFGTGNIALTNSNWSIGPSGPVITSNGSTSAGVVATTTNGPLDVTGTHISFGGWVYPKISNAYQLVLMRANGAGDGNRQYAVFLSVSGTTALYADLGGAILTPSLTVPWVINQWNHVFVTYDGANARFYINGKISNTTGLSGNILSFAGASMYILRDGPNNNFTLNGYADMMSVYNVTLSPAAIQQLASNGPFSMFQPQTQIFLDQSPAASATTPVSQFFKSIWYKAVLR